jgi:sortase A
MSVRESIRVQAESESSTVQPLEVGSDRYSVSSIGLMYIPRLKSDVWGTPILVGVGDRELALGIGYYPGAALPGESGNFSVAAHRATNGEPFARFEKLQSGDRVFIQTSAGWFEYELLQNEKILDRETWVLDATPKGLQFESEQLITLTTCDPRWNSTRRWAWWGALVSKSDEAPAAIGGSDDL